MTKKLLDLDMFSVASPQGLLPNLIRVWSGTEREALTVTARFLV